MTTASQGKASGETKPAHTLISDFWPPELGGNGFLLFKPPARSVQTRQLMQVHGAQCL